MWRDDDETTTIELYGTRSRAFPADTLRALQEALALSHVDITIETTRLL